MLPFKNIQSKMLPVSDPNAIWPTKILPPYPIYGDPSKKGKTVDSITLQKHHCDYRSSTI